MSNYDNPEKATVSESEVVPTPEIARRLNSSERTAQRAISRGDIPSVQFGRRKVVLRAVFEHFMRGEVAIHGRGRFAVTGSDAAVRSDAA